MAPRRTERCRPPTESQKKRRIACIDPSDEEGEHLDSSLSFVPSGTKMNGHSTPKYISYKKGRTSAIIQEQRTQLPIYTGKDALVQSIRENDVTVLLGETGSGKTTQVPQYLLEAGFASAGMIAVTQPRRVAAISLATRVATEQSVPLGTSVGYQVRFNERTSSETKIKYVTDGMLVRELLNDRLLNRYSVVVVDEAHERTLRTDLLIANLKSILRERNGDLSDSRGKGKAALNPLKVVIMSATLDAAKFSSFFDNARILYVKGRQHPVKVYHTATSAHDYVDAACRTFYQIHTDQPPGDVLIFMPGQEDIESLESSIRTFAHRLPKDSLSVQICPLYAALSPAQQFKVFSPPLDGARKCIIATNIAETSITVPGVKYVIDSGKYKEKNYVVKKDGNTGFDALIVKDVTKSSAMQRAGRAGREGPGVCFRLFTEEAYNTLPNSAEPEIRRCSLASSMLELKCMGWEMDEIGFMDPPDRDSIASALKTLFFIGAIDANKRLTKTGEDMAKFPLEPVHACAILASRTYSSDVTSAVVSIASILSASSKIFIESSEPGKREDSMEARRKFLHPCGDHLTRLNALHAYEEIAQEESKSGRRDWCRRNYVNERTCTEILSIREQVRGVCERLGVRVAWGAHMSSPGSLGDHHEAGVLRSLTTGYALNSAFLQPDGTYKQVMGASIVKLHPSSVLCDKKVPAVIFDDLTHTTQVYARGVSSVPRAFIADIPAFKGRGA